MEELWYKTVTYEDAKELVKENLVSTVAAFIASGYWLKCIRDSRGYEKDGYRTLWECAEAEFGLKKSEASRAMSMNDKYSVDGNSPYVIESYKQYSKSQLHEMLKMTDEQMGQVTPDMTVKDIREMKREKMEAFGEAIKPELESWERLLEWVRDFTRYEYKRLSQGCGEEAGIDAIMLRKIYGKELCTQKMQEIVLLDDENAQLVSKETGEIIGEYDPGYVAGEINRLFLGVREMKRKKILPELKGLTDSPYCGICGAPLIPPDEGNVSLKCSRCGQAVDWSRYVGECCDIATNTVNTVCGEESAEEFLTEIEVVPEQEEPLSVEFNTDELLRELEGEEDGQAGAVEGPKKCTTGFSRYGVCSCCGYGGVQCCVQCSEDCNMRCSCGYIDDPYVPEKEAGAEEEETEIAVEPVWPALPKFKNDGERKAWLEDVDAWGLWYEDPNIEARYYKYDFSDGSRLIAVKYRYTCPPWMKEREMDEIFRENVEADGQYRDTYYHMIYGEEYRKTSGYACGRYYGHDTVPVSVLIDFIRKLTKKEHGHEQSDPDGKADT